MIPPPALKCDYDGLPVVAGNGVWYHTVKDSSPTGRRCHYACSENGIPTPEGALYTFATVRGTTDPAKLVTK